VSAVDVDTGEYTLFNNTNLDYYSELAHAAMSSGSIPGVFPPQRFKDRWFMDGGTVWNVNIDSAIQGCLEKVDSLDKITIDIFSCGVDILATETNASTSAKGNYDRHKTIYSYYSGTSEIASHMKAYPTVNWRYYIQEQGALGGTAEIDFRN